MSMQSAEQLLDKIHSDVPEFARDTNVMRLDLGHLYEIFTDQKLGHLKVNCAPKVYQFKIGLI